MQHERRIWLCFIFISLPKTSVPKTIPGRHSNIITSIITQVAASNKGTFIYKLLLHVLSTRKHILLLRNIYCVEGITNSVAKGEDNFLEINPFNMYHSKAINNSWNEHSCITAPRDKAYLPNSAR